MNSITKRLSILVLALLVAWLGYGTAGRAENLSARAGLFSLAAVAPAGVALDGAENLYVAESTLGRVAIIDNNGVRLAELAGFKQPISLAVDENAGLLFVGDAGAGSVLVYGPDLTRRGQLGAGQGEFERPVGIGVDANGQVYVVDSDRNRVRVYDADYRFLFEFGQTGSLAGQLRRPVSLAVDRGSNEVLVVDRPIIKSTNGDFEGSRVQFFDPSGRYQRGFGQYGAGEGKLAKATGAAPDHGGLIHVCDAELNVVTIFDRNGTYIETIYDQTAPMATPVGAVVGSASGRLFVSSISGDRVNVYGSTEQHLVVATASPGGILAPAGQIAVDHGRDLRFTVQPEPGYHVEAVLIDGVEIEAAETFGLPVVVGDHSVFVQFSKDFHTVWVDTSVGGSVSPSGTLSVAHHEDLTLAIAAAPGYRIAEVLVDGVGQGPLAQYTFAKVAEEHTVLATFSRITHTIAATAGPGGSITPAGLLTVNQGSSAAFAMSAVAGYRLSALTVDGVSLAPVDTYTFAGITIDHAIRAEFEREVLEISASASTGGQISPSGVVKVEYGADQAFGLVPDQGHHITEVYVDGSPVGAASRYTFTTVTGPRAIRAEFSRNRYVISASVQGRGTVNPTGIIDALYGDSRSFTVTPAPGQRVAMILVDGQAVEPAATLAFTGIDANHTLTVFFAENNEAPLALAGPDQKVAAGEVVLNGEHSLDPDGIVVSYLWEQIDGPAITLVDPTTATASFMAPGTGAQGDSLLFRLTVTDNKGAVGVDECLITLTDGNLPPVALAGPDRLARPGETVVLDGSDSLDVDGMVVSWTWLQIAGQPVTLSSRGAAAVSFMAPAGDTSLAFRLLVTDDTGLRAKDDCLINVTASLLPPMAEAGANLIVRAGETVVLDGRGSWDPDDGIASHLWKQVNGTPAVSLAEHAQIQASFVAPWVESDEPVLLTFELQVADRSGLAATDRMTVSVHKGASGRGQGEAGGRIAKGNWLSMAIELPDGLPLDSIDPASIAVTRINGMAVETPFFRSGPLQIGDSNRNRIPDLTAKFDRSGRLGDLLGTGAVVVTVSGELADGSEFRQEFRMVLD